MFKRLKTNSVNLLALGAIGGLFLAAFFMRNNPDFNQTWPVLLLASIAVSFFAGIFNYWKLLKISEAPISTIAAAAQGYIELQGVASCDATLKTPYHGINCVWYRAYVFANREQHGNNAGVDDNVFMNSRLLDYSESQLTFTLTDKTGQCRVNPSGAEVIHFEARTWRKNDHRYVEEYLPTGKPLYVIGNLDTRKKVVDEAALNHAVGTKLADWKTRPQQLLNRYDQNLNGQIDMDEWELARRDAINEVKAEHAMQASFNNTNNSGFTLTKPAGKLFLISAKSPQQLRASYKIWIVAHLGLLAFLLAFYIKLT